MNRHYFFGESNFYNGSTTKMKKIEIILGFSFILGIAATTSFAQNYKIKQTTNMAGQNISSTIYVKGSRKRTESSGMMGMGADVATIEQCDLKRNVKVSDKKKQYFVEPFATNFRDTTTSAGKISAPTGGKPTKGGTLTMTSSINDTGERKQMFGLAARHLKTSMKMESSPDACSQSNMQMETDGWYVDLPQFACPYNVSGNTVPYQRPARNGCQDRMVVKETGGGKLGFPLQVTTTMNGGEGNGFSQMIETIEFSKAVLDDALFDVPTSYTLAKNEQDLYGRPDFSAIMRGGQSGGDDEDKPKSKSTKSIPDMPMQSGTPSSKKAGTIRIGVLAPTNRGGETISLTNMQAFLAQKLTSGNVEGIAVSSEADARTAGCDYLLTSDFSKLKQSTAAKIGGMFGKITNTGVNGNYDTQVDYKLVSLKSGQVTLQNKATSKTEANVDRSAESVLEIEAGAVVIAGLKN